ncbi:Legumain [Varanus komodoensis]|nr:Legumain [Varanus komodoensis]
MALKLAGLLICILGISALPLEDPEDGGKHWVVIVAGSNGWYNYRHQADACHAYQIVHRNGIPDEQIIVMMYDDIAENEQNPTKGIIINRPNGSDVYHGTLKDYVKEDVTPENFLAVLKGDAEAVKNKGSGRVLRSGPKDHVFVYFTDHGAPGILAFPSSDVSHFLYPYPPNLRMCLWLTCKSGNGCTLKFELDILLDFISYEAASVEDQGPCTAPQGLLKADGGALVAPVGREFENLFPPPAKRNIHEQNSSQWMLPPLHVQALKKAIQYMHHHKKYKKMVFYIEACESGSMMDHLPDDIDVYATTAANPDESSYACYYDEQRETYLGDWYSVNWMEDSDVEDLKKETLHKQFLLVRKHTNTSHVMQYGNLSIAHMKVVQFQGTARAPSTPISLPPVTHYDLTPSPDVPFAIMKRKLMATNDAHRAKSLLEEMNRHLEAKELIKESMRKIIFSITHSEELAEPILSRRSKLRNYDCYESAVNHFKSHCFNWHSPLFEYALRQLYVLVNVCEAGYPIER